MARLETDAPTAKPASGYVIPAHLAILPRILRPASFDVDLNRPDWKAYTLFRDHISAVSIKETAPP